MTYLNRKTDKTGRIEIMKMKHVIFSLMICLPVVASGQLAVIVNEKNEIESLTEEQVSNIYLGRSYYLPNGVKVIPLDQSEGDSTREAFYEHILGKSQAQINSHWSRQIFSGKGRPPFKVNGDKEMLELISLNPNMMGYIDFDEEDSLNAQHIKIILVIE